MAHGSAIELPEESFNITYQYIGDYWKNLTKTASRGDKNLFPLPYPYVVPACGMFEQLFYWDSYFTIVGLSVQGRNQLIRNTVDDLIYLMEIHGIIPNSNYCAERPEDSLSPLISTFICLGNK